MKQINLFTLSSELHSELIDTIKHDPFIEAVEAALGQLFAFKGENFGEYNPEKENVIYVRTGGTEGKFHNVCPEGEIRLLASGKINSLAASLEMLAWLNQQGRKGEILHGSPEEIAEAIKMKEERGKESNNFVTPLEKYDLGGARLGVIGKPSDWLIASKVDYQKAKEKLNVEIVDIHMDRLLNKMMAFEGDLKSFEGSEAIYKALKEIATEEGLSGLTIRCFDLLYTLNNTGCLALARLNAEGIPASCEGDVPALLTMMVTQKTKGVAGFQCNLSRIRGDQMLFAHCTVPLNMVNKYSYTTHFESGIGTAIKGEFPLSKRTIFKISPDLEQQVQIPAAIISNPSENNFCRTQILVRVPIEARDYFLHRPLGNHHVIV